jgi:uroporphyrin-III C-methyltransferase
LKTLKVISRNNLPVLKQISEVFSLLPGLKYELIKPLLFVAENNDDQLFTNLPNDISVPEFEWAILQHKADLAILPAKDLPYPIAAGLDIIALLPIGISEKSIGRSQFVSDPLPENLAIIARSDSDGLKSLFSDLDIMKKFGKVTLVGFGPGNPDLLTIKGDRSLSQADIIFHDDLIDKDFLKRYPAQKVCVGKRKDRHSFEQQQIHLLMLSAAKEGKQVVRLKGGDPMVFARGGEEVEYLQRNLIRVEVIPGISTGMAIASLSKIPLTQRKISSSVAFITGHSETTILPDTDTLVIYMGGSTIRKIAIEAIEQGRDPDTPVILVHNVSMPDQKEFFFTLSELSLNEEKFPTPLTAIIGRVVSLRHHAADELQKTPAPDTYTQNAHLLSPENTDCQHLNTMSRIEFSGKPEQGLSLNRSLPKGKKFVIRRQEINKSYKKQKYHEQ